MQLAGDEKKIQALFSELACEEAQAAPRFEKLWHAAALTQQALPQQMLRFSRSLVVIAATLLVAVAVLFAVWSNSKTPVEQHAQTVSPRKIASPPAPEAGEPDNKTTFVPRRPRPHSTRRQTLARRQQSERALQQQAAMLASWKSPTANFMASPTLSGFSSLPQLNESVKDLQSFLQTKESNQ